MSEQSNVTSGNAEKSRPLNFVQSCCRTSEAAAYLGLSPRTLERHRCCATGPAYHKLGGRVVYPSASVRCPARCGLHFIGLPFPYSNGSAFLGFVADGTHHVAAAAAKQLDSAVLVARAAHRRR